MNGTRTQLAPVGSWQMDPGTAAEPIAILGILEDVLRLGGHEVIEELARIPIAHPLDASRWAHWLADDLADQVITVRAATRAATCTAGSEPAPMGDLP